MSTKHVTAPKFRAPVSIIPWRAQFSLLVDMVSKSVVFLFSCLSIGVLAVVDSDACLGGISWKVTAINECSIESLKEALKPRFDKRCKRFGLSLDEDIQLLLGTESNEEARKKMEEICKNALDKRHPKKLEFGSISNKGREYDSEFFGGGTSWNSGGLQHLGKGSFRGSGARRIDMYDRQSKRRVLKWPEEVPSLSGCQANAAMCCWPANPNEEISAYGTVDCDPIDGEFDCEIASAVHSKNVSKSDINSGNSGVCLVDLSKSSSSHGFNGGLTIFPNNTSVYCSGIAWENGENYWNHYANGNLLFQSSMMLMKDEGLEKNLPSSPMCGCIEKMPIVTRADCTEAYSTARFVFQYRSTIPELRATASKHLIQYRECEGMNSTTNDLKSFYDKLWLEKKVDMHQKELFDGIVIGEGGCNNVIKAHLVEFVEKYSGGVGREELNGTKDHNPQ